MIALSVIDLWFVIEYFAESPKDHIVFSFPRGLFPENELAKRLFSSGRRRTFILNNKEQQDIVLILRKLSAKDLNSDSLQRIYLVEFLHFLMKMCQHDGITGSNSPVLPN